MPIDLTKLVSNNAPILNYTPDFFSKEITGRGAGKGLFINSLNPLNAKLSTTEARDMNIYDLDMPERYTHRQNMNHEMVALHYITFDPNYKDAHYHASYSDNINSLMASAHLGKKNKQDLLLCDHLGAWQKLNVPSAAPVFVKNHASYNPDHHDFYLRLVPFRMRVRTATASVGGKVVRTKNAMMCWIVELYMAPKGGAPKYLDEINYLDLSDNMASMGSFLANDYLPNMASYHGKRGLLMRIYTTNPYRTLINNAGLSISENFDNTKKLATQLEKYLTTLNLYDMLSDLSKAYQTNYVDFIKFASRDVRPASDYDKRDNIIQLINKANTLRLPLDQYQAIYDFIQNNFKDKDVIEELLSSNLNLKFNGLLSDLDNAKPHLAYCPAKPGIKTNPKLSLEQTRAVKTAGPLTLIEAGAGTGKSSVILSRIKYLIDSGITPNTIQVLSFTNAAADHIKTLYPDINSTTIASLVAEIYDDNFPDQAIVSPMTFLNTLTITYSGTPNKYMEKFIEACRLLTQKPNKDDVNWLDEGYRQISALIKKKPSMILNVCKTLGQTTLDLQIMICYAFLEKLKLTEKTKSKFLLVDEVQDNSIFEFMFYLKYTMVNKSSFFMVGDASQTLYEFRNANPRAMNVLESAGVFDIFKLEVNFRSNQEILAYANSLLSEAQSNYFARIQLKSNNLRTVTRSDFKQNVNYLHVDTDNIIDLEGMAKTIAQNMQVQDYITNCVARGENVAILAWSRRTVRALQEAFSTVNHAKYENIMAQRIVDNTLFSGFWAHEPEDRKNNMLKLNLKQILNTIRHELAYANPDPNANIISQNAQTYVTNYWDDFVRNNATLIRDMEDDLANKKIAMPDALKQLMHLMLNYEISTNHKRQYMSKNINSVDKRKQTIAQNKVIFSTIHSVKGLEFDNVILYMSTDHLVEDESLKRLYYVGLTRAKHSELVLDANHYDINDSLMHANYKQASKNFI